MSLSEIGRCGVPQPRVENPCHARSNAAEFVTHPTLAAYPIS
jgi:hypothetical protein